MDVNRLRTLLDAAGPFSSVYYDSSQDTEDAARRIDLRWRAIHDRLDAAGAGAETLAALDAAVAEGTPSRGRAGRALVAAGDTVLLDERLPDPPVQVARVSSLPYLMPLIELGHRQVPHVVAVVDRTGADLRAVDDTGADRAAHPVQGRQHPVHKVRGGGWSHWNIQHRVEEVVHGNVKQVAREVARLVDLVGARAVVLAGEVAARSALHDALAPRARAIAVEIEAGGRAEGTDPDALDSQVRQVVERNAEGRRQAVLERFRTERGRAGGLAAEGLAATNSALLAAAVEYLVVNGSALADSVVNGGRADEVLPAAALGTGAGIVPADDEEALPEGVGALLRHT